MDLFELNGKVAININEAIKGLDEVQKEGEKTEGKLGKVFSGIGKGAAVMGKAVGAAVLAAGTAVAGLVTSATSAYAEYEQLVGGVDTLFKESSAKVQAYAEKAYETAGMSANEYMNTVTSFSASLLQSLGGDTEKAADQADVAIRDMSDNANKMGTSMESIQNAYQGFAKQNYTMLDNLKLGYGGTKEEMERLLEDAERLSGKELDISSYADVVDAIHIIQTEMGITGTTAQEAAGTISGSLSSVKGAWTNLVTAMASDDLPLDEYITKFVESATTMVSNMLPRIQQALGGVVQLVDQLAPVILAKIPELVSQILPSLLDSAVGLVGVLVDIVPDLVNAILGMLPALIDGIQTLLSAILDSLPGIVESLLGALPTLLPILIDALATIILKICEVLPQIIKPIIDYLPVIIIALVEALVNNIPMLLEGIITLVLAIVEAIPTLVQGIVDATPTVVEMVVTSLLENLPLLLKGIALLIAGIVVALPKLLYAIDRSLINTLKGIWNGIKNVFAPVGKWFGDMFGDAFKNVKKAFSKAGSFFKDIWTNIKKPFTSVTSWFKGKFTEAWSAVKGVFSTGGKIFDGIKDGIANVFTTTVNKIIGGINRVIAVPFNALNDVLARIKDVEIMGLSPFTWVTTFDVPEIPLIEWNAKAVNAPRIFDEPTIYGYNPSTGTFQGAGDGSDSEVVSGTSTLMNMIASAVASQNATLVSVLSKILEAILGMDENMGGHLREALDGVSFDVNKREFARLVKETV